MPKYRDFDLKPDLFFNSKAVLTPIRLTNVIDKLSTAWDSNPGLRIAVHSDHHLQQSLLDIRDDHEYRMTMGIHKNSKQSTTTKIFKVIHLKWFIGLIIPIFCRETHSDTLQSLKLGIVRPFCTLFFTVEITFNNIVRNDKKTTLVLKNWLQLSKCCNVPDAINNRW